MKSCRVPIICEMVLLPLFMFFFSCGSSPGERPIDSLKSTKPDSVPDTAAMIMARTVIDPPEIRNVNGTCALVISVPVKLALKDYDSTFQAWDVSDFVKSCDGNSNYFSCHERQLQFAVIGDFNGDSVNDLAVLGHNKRNTLLIGVLSDSVGYSVVEIEKFPLENPQSTWIDDEENTGLYTYMEYCSAERAATSNWGNKGIEQDAFLYGTCGKAFSIYWFANGEFHRGTFSD